jgi:hypothetical protein
MLNPGAAASLFFQEQMTNHGNLIAKIVTAWLC